MRNKVRRKKIGTRLRKNRRRDLRTKGAPPRTMPPTKPEPAAMLVLRGEKAKTYGQFRPKRDGDVGFDLYCVKDTVIKPGVHRAPTEIPVDTCVKLPPGTFAMQIPRSSMHARFPTLMICLSPIDNGYTGQIGPRFKNIGRRAVRVPAGTAISQLVLFGAIIPPVAEVDELPKTERGDQRFGSTGR